MAVACTACQQADLSGHPVRELSYNTAGHAGHFNFKTLCRVMEVLMVLEEA